MLIADIYPLFQKYLSYTDYYNILSSCKMLYQFEQYIQYYICDIYIDKPPDLLIQTLILNDSDILKDILDIVPDAHLHIFTLAATAGYEKIIEYILTINITVHINQLTHYCLNGAASAGHLHIFKLIDKKYKVQTHGFTGHLIYSAARDGHLNLIKWLTKRRNMNDKCDDETFRIAKENDHYHIIQWYYKTKCLYMATCDINIACSMNELARVKWLINHGCILTENNIGDLLYNRSFDFIYWIIDNSLLPHMYDVHNIIQKLKLDESIIIEDLLI